MKGNRAKLQSAPKPFWRLFLFFYIWGIITTGIGILLVLVLHFERYNEAVIYGAALLFGVFGVWAIWSWREMTASVFDAYTLFFISALLFNGGEALLRCFGVDARFSFFEYFCERTVAETLGLVLLGLYAFHAGALLCGKISLGFKTSFHPGNAAQLEEIRWVGWILIFLSFLPAVFYFQDSLSSVMNYGYFSLFNLDPTIGFAATDQVLATFLVPGVLFLLAGSRGKLFNLIMAMLLIGSYTAVRLFLGSRAWAAMPVIVFAFIWHRAIFKIPKILLFSGGMLLLFLIFPLVGEIRNIPGQQRLSFPILAEIFISLENPVISILSEMGGSIKTVAYTLELVPEVRSYDFGVGYLNAVFTVVPNLFWSIHPAIARGTAGEWLMKTIDPLTAYLGGSMGYSFIAESYLNFGWIGSPLLLFGLGIAYAKLVFWAQEADDPARMAMLASFLSFVLFFPRSESALVVRPLIWYAFVPYLMVLSIRYLKKVFR